MFWNGDQHPRIDIMISLVTYNHKCVCLIIARLHVESASSGRISWSQINCGTSRVPQTGEVLRAKHRSFFHEDYDFSRYCCARVAIILAVLELVRLDSISNGRYLMLSRAYTRLRAGSMPFRWPLMSDNRLGCGIKVATASGSCGTRGSRSRRVSRVS